MGRARLGSSADANGDRHAPGEDDPAARARRCAHAEEFARLCDPAVAATLLPHDYFVPGGGAGIVPLRFPFSFSLAMLPRQYRVRAWLAGVPSYAPFYAADHPSGAFDVTLAILAAFDREARARGQSPLVLLIPDVADLWALRDGRTLPYAPIAAALQARGIETVDVGTELWRRLAGRDPCEVYTRCGGGHLTAEGNAMVAALLTRRVRELGLVDR